MGAVVYRPKNEDSILDLFADARKERGRETPFQKFSKSTDKDNFVLTKLLGARPVATIACALYKPDMAGTHIRGDAAKEYFYLLKLVLERVSWCVRDGLKGLESGKCRVILSEQRTHSYDDLDDYLRLLRHGRGRFNCSIEWDWLEPEFEVIKHQNETPIHLADITASAFGRAIEPKEHGMTDPRFFQNLGPSVFKRGSSLVGVKVFPKASSDRLDSAGELNFLKALK